MRSSIRRELPVAVWLIAAAMALLHLAPHWRAESQTPAGWMYTGNLSIWPDEVQYRVWMRQAQYSGAMMTDVFTSEPNKPHLPVALYYTLGKVAQWTGLLPEWVYNYFGAVFSFVFTLLLFLTVRLFLGSSGRVWMVFLVLLLGGGLGAYFKFFELVWANSGFLRRNLPEPLIDVRFFEDYRENYIFKVLFDTHFAFFWLLALAAVLSLYLTLRRFSFPRLAVTCALYAASTYLHVYDGVTLIAISCWVALVLYAKRHPIRPALTAAVAVTAISGIVFAWLLGVHKASGLPLPGWRSPNILVAVLLVSYPLAWIGIAGGLREYWRNAGFRECFVIGWTVACLAIALSGPFYPYPARGTLTLQVPLYIMAGAMYFNQRRKVSRTAVVLTLLLLGATPAWIGLEYWRISRFRTDRAAVFMDHAHEEIARALTVEASPQDLLLARELDARWLAPYYPGRHYCAHFFLTVDYDRKSVVVDRFFRESTAPQQIDFLRRERVRFIYVDAQEHPERFSALPGMRVVVANSAGTLFEHPRDLVARFVGD